MGYPRIVLRRAAVHLFFSMSLVAGLVGLALLPDAPEAPAPAGDETAQLLDRCIHTMSNQGAPVSDDCHDGGGTCCTTGDDDDDDDGGGTTTTTSPTGGDDDDDGTTTTTSPTGDDDDDDDDDDGSGGDDDDDGSGGDDDDDDGSDDDDDNDDGSGGDDDDDDGSAGDENGVPGSSDTDETDPFSGDDDDDASDGARGNGDAPGTSDANDGGERSRGGYDEHVGSDIGHQGLVHQSAGSVSFALPFGTLKLPVDDLRTGLLVWTIFHGLGALWIGQRRLRWLLLPAGRRRDHRDGDTPFPA